MEKTDIRTQAFVLRRTNFGEADRILNLITPLGKISAIAKGVRKEKSRLAGGVEMLSLTEINIHKGKGNLGTVTSAKMIKYYDKILTDFQKMEFVGNVLKKISAMAEHSDSVEYFEMTKEILEALNSGENRELVEAWFLLNVAVASGEDVNLYRDVAGEKLSQDARYEWDFVENAFNKKENGMFGANEIKAMRLMITTKIGVVKRIKDIYIMVPGILRIARAVNKF